MWPITSHSDGRGRHPEGCSKHGSRSARRAAKLIGAISSGTASARGTLAEPCGWVELGRNRRRLRRILAVPRRLETCSRSPVLSIARRPALPQNPARNRTGSCASSSPPEAAALLSRCWQRGIQCYWWGRLNFVLQSHIARRAARQGVRSALSGAFRRTRLSQLAWHTGRWPNSAARVMLRRRIHLIGSI